MLIHFHVFSSLSREKQHFFKILWRKKNTGNRKSFNISRVSEAVNWLGWIVIKFSLFYLPLQSSSPIKPTPMWCRDTATSRKALVPCLFYFKKNLKLLALGDTSFYHGKVKPHYYLSLLDFSVAPITIFHKQRSNATLVSHLDTEFYVPQSIICFRTFQRFPHWSTGLLQLTVHLIFLKPIPQTRNIIYWLHNLVWISQFHFCCA